MGLFTIKGNSSVAKSPEIDVKGAPLFKPGFWMTRRVPRPPRSQQPSSLTSPVQSDFINAQAKAKAAEERAYQQTLRSNSMQFTDGETYQGADGKTYRRAPKGPKAGSTRNKAEQIFRGQDGRMYRRSAGVNYKPVNPGETFTGADGRTYRRAPRTNSVQANPVEGPTRLAEARRVSYAMMSGIR